MAWNISFSAQELIFSCWKQINSWQFLDLKWSFLQCIMHNLHVTKFLWKPYLSDLDPGFKNRGLYWGKYPLYGCFASFVKLITHNYVMFRFNFETGYYA